MPVKVSNQKVEEACLKMCELLSTLPGEFHKRKSCHHFIPVGQYNATSQHYVVSDETARRIDILLGPHAKAIFTAWAIKQASTEERK